MQNKEQQAPDNRLEQECKKYMESNEFTNTLYFELLHIIDTILKTPAFVRNTQDIKEEMRLQAMEGLLKSIPLWDKNGKASLRTFLSNRAKQEAIYVIRKEAEQIEVVNNLSTIAQIEVNESRKAYEKLLPKYNETDNAKLIKQYAPIVRKLLPDMKELGIDKINAIISSKERELATFQEDELTIFYNFFTSLMAYRLPSHYKSQDPFMDEMNEIKRSITKSKLKRIEQRMST